MTIKLSFRNYMHEFREIVQKLVYSVWNKYCSEELHRKEESYLIKDMKFTLSPDAVDLMVERYEREKIRDHMGGKFTQNDEESSMISRGSIVVRLF